ncbi:MAG: CbtA family protein [Nocardioidaceae bacterium]
MWFTKLLRHGVTAGAAAGLSAALVLWLVVEPVIRRALIIEQAREEQHHGPSHEPLVSRTLQVFGGVATAALVGVMVGVVFAVVFARTRHRLPGRTDVGRSAALATAAFLVVTLLPALKIPANPPGVGDPATVAERTLLYVLTVLVGLLGVGLVSAVDRRLAVRGLGIPQRMLANTAVAVLCVVAVLALVPTSPDTVPADVPPTLLWDFRVASLAQLATMWLVMGMVFGAMVESRAHARDAVPSPA